MKKLNREALRREAKKAYKEACKNVPKRQRMPFARFFKDYKNTKSADHVSASPVEEEDFDFENFINVNEISDDDVEDTDDNE